MRRKAKHRHRGKHRAKVHPEGDAALAAKGNDAGGVKRCWGGTSKAEKEQKEKKAQDAKDAAAKAELPIDEAIREVVAQTFEEVPTAGEGLTPLEFGLVVRTFNRWDRLAISFLGRD